MIVTSLCFSLRDFLTSTIRNIVVPIFLHHSQLPFRNRQFDCADTICWWKIQNFVLGEHSWKENWTIFFSIYNLVLATQIRRHNFFSLEVAPNKFQIFYCTYIFMCSSFSDGTERQDLCQSIIEVRKNTVMQGTTPLPRGPPWANS